MQVQTKLGLQMTIAANLICGLKVITKHKLFLDTSPWAGINYHYLEIHTYILLQPSII